MSLQEVRQFESWAPVAVIWAPVAVIGRPSKGSAPPDVQVGVAGVNLRRANTPSCEGPLCCLAFRQRSAPTFASYCWSYYGVYMTVTTVHYYNLVWACYMGIYHSTLEIIRSFGPRRCGCLRNYNAVLFGFWFQFTVTCLQLRGANKDV